MTWPGRATQPLDLARQLGIPLEEAHALAGLGRCARGSAAPPKPRRLRQALAIFQGSAPPKPSAYPPNWARCGDAGSGPRIAVIPARLATMVALAPNQRILLWPAKAWPRAGWYDTVGTGTYPP